MLAEGSLYEAAARDLSAFRLQGRGVAYAIALPATGTHAVVRHNRHGGKLARLTRDLFLPPTRAPHELAVALRLRELGIPTPDVLMYGTSPAPFPFRRADVVTRRIEGGRDLATFMAWKSPSDEREAAWAATRALVRAMNEAGVRHHDLNVKNVLIAPSEGGLTALSPGRRPRHVRSAGLGGGGAGKRGAAAPLRAEVARAARRAVRRERARRAPRTAGPRDDRAVRRGGRGVAARAGGARDRARGMGAPPTAPAAAADAAARAVDPASGGRRRRAAPARGARRAARPCALRAAPPPGPGARVVCSGIRGTCRCPRRGAAWWWRRFRTSRRSCSPTRAG